MVAFSFVYSLSLSLSLPFRLISTVALHPSSPSHLVCNDSRRLEEKIA